MFPLLTLAVARSDLVAEAPNSSECAPGALDLLEHWLHLA